MFELGASFEQMALEMMANLVQQDHQLRPIAFTILGDLIHESRIVEDQALAGGVHVSQRIGDWGRTINKIGVESDMFENIDK